MRTTDERDRDTQRYENLKKVLDDIHRYQIRIQERLQHIEMQLRGEREERELKPGDEMRYGYPGG